MVDVRITTESRYLINRSALKRHVEVVMRRHYMKGPLEVELLFVGDRKMRTLNRKFRNLDQTTDVLSFPLEDPEHPNAFPASADGVLRLGMVVVSYPQAILEAAEENTLVDAKIEALVEHGILHLLGIHHEENVK